MELEKIKNTVGKSPDNVIRVRAGKQLAACKAKINEIMPKYKNLRAQLDNARKKLEAICDQVDKVGQELENVEMDEQAVYMLKKLTAQKNELAAVGKGHKGHGDSSMPRRKSACADLARIRLFTSRRKKSITKKPRSFPHSSDRV